MAPHHLLPQRFSRGVCCYPEPWPPGTWAGEARQIRELGRTSVRMAAFAWSPIEPAPRRFARGWLEAAVAVFANAGLRVVLGTPTTDLDREGDRDRGQSQTRKAALQDRRAALPPEGNPDDDAGKRLAGDLAAGASAWRVATSAERNRLARTCFTGVAVANRMAVAMVSRPDLRPLLCCQPTRRILHRRKRRGLVARSHHAIRVSGGGASARPTSGRSVWPGVLPAPAGAPDGRRASGDFGPRHHQEPALLGRRLRREPRDGADGAARTGAQPSQHPRQRPVTNVLHQVGSWRTPAWAHAFEYHWGPDLWRSAWGSSWASI